jgi:hypothetical protein
MIRYQALEREHLPRRDVSKAQFVGVVTDLITPQDNMPAPRPQAFLVEQTPNWSLTPHFHEEHQFQVFVQGHGSLGSKPVDLFAVHYASPHTGYGPLNSGDQGISYLTLRAVGDTGAWYLPESRGRNLRIPKVGAHATPSSPVDAAALLTLTVPQTEVLIEPRLSGLAAWLIQLGPGQTLPPPAGAEHGGGRFLVVAQGLLCLPEAQLPPPGVVWVGTHDHLDLTAGPCGLAVLVLQFPAEAAQSFLEAHPELRT